MCGENFPLNILDLILNSFKVDNIFNCYGSTETSPWAFFFHFKQKFYELIKKNGQVPIGNPFKDLKIKFGKSGELLINGPIISKGYIAEDKMNKEKFVNIDNNIYYKTGDIVKKIKGLYFCKGRNDTQVKLRGFRIDTTEIESHVKKIKLINYSYCYLNSKSINPYIVLICVYEEKISESDIIYHLKKYIPTYMLPKKIVLLKKLKFNKNGKVDKTYYKNKY